MPRHHLLFLLLIITSPSVMAGGIAADVGVSGFTYTPDEVTIEAGETINFTASGLHPLRFDDNPDLACDQDCNITFRTPGTYGFFCFNHGGGGMTGTVTVSAGPGDDRIFLDTFQLSYD